MIVGDTQETALIERLVGLEQNAARRVHLLDELAARRPDAVLHLGDLVTFGSAPGHWARLDQLLAPLRAANVPLLPVVGNHDRMIVAKLGLRQLAKRFEVLRTRTWYDFELAGVAFIALDSNLVRGATGEAQVAWLEEVVGTADADPDIKAIVAYWHHPPMSNSRIVRPSRHAREVFLGTLGRSKKALAVFTGHAHAYEHFIVDGVHCFVSGGGGGPRHTLEVRPERWRARDLFGGGAKRFMHFLELEIGDDALTIATIRMADGTHRCDEADRVTLPFAARQSMWRCRGSAAEDAHEVDDDRGGGPGVGGMWR